MSASAFTSGRNALAICDRCGQAFAYLSLMREFIQVKNIQGTLARTNIRVCRDCVDSDTRVRRVKTDPQALRNPRPDVPEPSLSNPQHAISDPLGGNGL